MKYIVSAARWLGILFVGLLATPGQATPWIQEFMAVNTSGLQDEDGDYSDWIEILHSGPEPLNLTGWHLTDTPDNLTRWTFPSRILQTGERVIVFASGKNRISSHATLHANFSLAREGEFLALVAPDGTTIVHQYAPYPEQVADISFGLGAGLIPGTDALIAPGSSAQLLIPTNAISMAWRDTLSFDDSTWTNVTLGIGYNLDGGPVLSDPVETVAYEIATGQAGNQSYGGALGMDFFVIEPIILSEIGVFDDGSDGLNRTITAELWSRDDGETLENPNDDTGISILASKTFTPTQSGTLTGGSRFLPLTAPLKLQPGAYTIVAHGYGAGERNGNTNGGSDFGPLNNPSGAIGFTGRSRFGTAGSFPGSVDGGPEGRYGAGTFKYYLAIDPRIQTNIENIWHGVNASALLRIPFLLANTNRITGLHLNTAFDDGYAAYLNGQLVASNNVPSSLNWDSSALVSSGAVNHVDLSPYLQALEVGTNLLAVHAANLAASDRDALIDLQLLEEYTDSERLYFPYPTPGDANSIGGYGTGLIINEVYSDPGTVNDTEFIELYNAGTSNVLLTGFHFADGIDFVFPPGSMVTAGGYVVIAATPTAISNQYPDIDVYGPFTGRLANNGEQITLYDAYTNRIDQVSYGIGAPWPVTGDEPETSLQLLHPRLDNDLSGSWRAAAPTPGSLNATFQIRPPPQIRQVSHTPRVPTSGAAVLVQCKVTDPDGVAEVQLDYQMLEPGAYINANDPAYATNWTTIAMAAASDGIFSVTLPGTMQTHRRLIRYRIRATDVLGSTVQLPLPSDPSLNFAYFVYDGVPAWTAADIPGQTVPQTYSTNIMNALPVTHLIAQEQDILNSQYNQTFNDKVYRFSGSLVYDGEVYDHIHYRIRGSGSTYNTGKNKWKIRFNRGRFFQPVDEYGREWKEPVRTLNWSALASPWNPANRGASGLDEALAFRLWQRAGSLSLNTSYFHLRIIDDALEQDPANQFEGDNWGLYLAIEQADKRFLDARDLPDGNVFNNHFGSSNFLNRGRDQPDDRSDLFTFTGSGANGYNRNPVQPVSWWEANVNLDGYFAYRAVIEAINHSDLRDRENSIYYHNPVSGIWSVIPWDVDLLYEEFDRWGPNGVQSAATLEQFRKCLTHPEVNIRFQNRARELQDLLLNADQGWSMVDEILHHIAHLDGGLGWPEVDRARWDHDPRSRSIEGPSPGTGSFFLNPYTSTRFPPLGRTLTSANFDGMTDWVKTFIAPTGFGGGRLAAMIADQDIPEKPVIAYTGATNYPLGDIEFISSAFTPGQGGAPFQAQQWRIGQVRNPTTIDYQPNEPWIYEVDTFWSREITQTFEATLEAPAGATKPGHTYRARVRHQGADGRWSHWSDAIEFTPSPPDLQAYLNGLVVSEVMYNPGDNQNLEFIELHNVGPMPLSIEHLQFSEGIEYSFENAAITSLATGAYVLVVRDIQAFEAHYGSGLPVAGEYRSSAVNNLSNEGERITLSLGTGTGTVIRTFHYDNNAPWPEDAAGSGYSLTLIAPTHIPDHTLAGHWRGSVQAGGSPGQSDSLTFTGVPESDVNTNGIPDLIDYALTEMPTGTLSDGVFEYTVNQRVGADAALVEVQVSFDLNAWFTHPAQLSESDPARTSEAYLRSYRIETEPYSAFRLRISLR